MTRLRICRCLRGLLFFSFLLSSAANAVDTDGDGIPDSIEGTLDTDDDLIIDAEAIDADGDGLPDSLEVGLSAEQLLADADADGVIDLFDADVSTLLDRDGDGIIDSYDFPDADGDGIADFREADSDNDGVPDFIEAGLLVQDSDADGLSDSLDADTTGGPDINADGIDDSYTPLDTDRDAKPDYRDLDADNDGIADLIEVFRSFDLLADQDRDGLQDLFDFNAFRQDLSRADVNGDGIDDTDRLPDADADGIPDYRDLDSDNDSIFDVVESGGSDVDMDGLVDSLVSLVTAPPDTDSDKPLAGEPVDATGLSGFDYVDLDSDGNFDGSAGYDIQTGPFAVLDGNGDGRIDRTVDADRDGIDDSVDRALGFFGNGGDTDGDGLFTDEDADDDNDGLPDVFEGEQDSDDDGLVNRLDVDSDNDGLLDSREMNLPAPSGLDANGNGLDDAFDVLVNGSGDGNGDGLDDNIQRVDTDKDGIDDWLDTDSDGDTVSDLEEQSGLVLFALDSDRDGIDDALDVDTTGGADVNMNSIDDRFDGVLDTDGDGLENYRDADSDNDGVSDGQEQADFNRDGIPDRLQRNPPVKTAISGTGATSLLSVGLLSLLGLLLAGMLPASRAQAALPGCFNEASGEEGGFSLACARLGVSLGLSNLEPETSGTGFSLEEDSDLTWRVLASVQFSRNLFAEIAYSDLGEAEVRSANTALGSAAISYSAASLSGGYLLNGNRKPWDVYIKAGLSTLFTDSDSRTVATEEDSSMQFTWGAGLLYHLTPALNLRAGFDSYSDDASAFTLGVGFAPAR